MILMRWGSPISKPCAEHLLGTNDVGQDIFSELIYGTRVSMLIGCFTAVIVTVLATGLRSWPGITAAGWTGGDGTHQYYYGLAQPGPDGAFWWRT